MAEVNPFDLDIPEVIGGDVPPEAEGPPEPPPPPMTDEEIVQTLLSYNQECEEARRSGHSPRDQIWENNWRTYWMLDDTSGKAAWQSKDVMPEAPQFVERWAAAIHEAIVQAGEWYLVKDPLRVFGGFAKEVKKIVNYWLDRAGETDQNQPIRFPAVFEELLKQAAITKFCCVVTWKKSKQTVMEAVTTVGADGRPQIRLERRERERGRVAIEPFDPRFVWRDPKGRGLYRRRRIEMDLHELQRLAETTDAEGQPLYRPDVVDQITETFISAEEAIKKEASTGVGQMSLATGRKPIVLDEYLCTIIKPDGTVAWPANTLVVMCNEKYIVRSPEPNPFWHGKDWVVDFPIITVPLSPDGKSYMEQWTGIAKTFTEMTRLILDAVFAMSMNAFVADPGQLEDPTELEEGVSPNKTFVASEGADPTKVIHEIELGKLPPEVVAVWQGIKQELREGAQRSEIAMGQLPPKGDITATEIAESQRESGSAVRSVAMTIEGRGLNVILDLTWQTGLQHMDVREEPELLASLGELGQLMARMTVEQRYRLIAAPYRFQANGISGIIDRSKDRNALLAFINMIGKSPILAKAFLERYSEHKVIERLSRQFGIDTDGLEREAGEPVPQMPVEGSGGDQPQALGTPAAIQGATMGG